jgi:hypothetical protein
MLTCYLIYNKHRVAEKRIEKGFCHEARDWAEQQYNLGISVFMGRYSIKHARWRWVKFIPGLQVNRSELGKAQPEPYRNGNKVAATM